MSKIIRDFSKETVNRILELIQLNEEDDTFFLFEWAEDEFVKQELEIQDYLDDVKKYHREMVDKHNLGYEEFIDIVYKVHMVDLNYGRRLESINDGMLAFVKQVNGLTEILAPNKMVLSSEQYHQQLKTIEQEYTEAIEEVKGELALYEENSIRVKPYTWQENFYSCIQGILMMGKEKSQPTFELLDWIFGTDYAEKLEETRRRKEIVELSENEINTELYSMSKEWSNKIWSGAIGGCVEVAECFTDVFAILSAGISGNRCGLYNEKKTWDEYVKLKGTFHEWLIGTYELDATSYQNGKVLVDVAMILYSLKNLPARIEQYSQNAKTLYLKLKAVVQSAKVTGGQTEYAFAEIGKLSSADTVSISLDPKAVEEYKIALQEIMSGKKQAYLSERIGSAGMHGLKEKLKSGDVGEKLGSETSYAQSSENLEKIKIIMSEGEISSNGRRIVYELDDTTRINFGLDIGENAHQLRNQGYLEPTNHMNIEIQKISESGKVYTKWDIHLILDENNNVINQVITGPWKDK